MPDTSIEKESNFHTTKAALAVIIIAMLLRLLLGLYNREANDNHIDVVNIIADQGRIPEKSDCWSCYQPKLYYLVCAGLVKALHATGNNNRILVMNLTNVFLSLFILLLFRKFLDKQELSPLNKLLFFAFFAFNPCMVGINVQGTNDTLGILAGMCAVYWGGFFFSTMRLKWLLLVSLALLMGVLTKGTSLTMIGVVALVLVIKTVAAPVVAEKLKAFKLLVLCLAFVVPLSFFAGGYYHNYKTYHSLSLSTWDQKDPFPYLFKKTWIENVRPGVENIYGSFMTFRYFDLIIQPYITNGMNDYPGHRVSWASQLYGRTFFMHFDQWPPGWQTQAPFIIWLGRILLTLAIVPFLFFVSGIIINIVINGKHLIAGDRLYFASSHQYFYLLVTMAYLASSVYYCCQFRDFSAMKSIYIFPAFLAFIKMFCDGFKLLKNRALIVAAQVVLLLMIVASITDIIYLIVQLHRPVLE